MCLALAYWAYHSLFENLFFWVSQKSLEKDAKGGISQVHWSIQEEHQKEDEPVSYTFLTTSNLEVEIVLNCGLNDDVESSV